MDAYRADVAVTRDDAGACRATAIPRAARPKPQWL